MESGMTGDEPDIGILGSPGRDSEPSLRKETKNLNWVSMAVWNGFGAPAWVEQEGWKEGEPELEFYGHPEWSHT